MSFLGSPLWGGIGVFVGIVLGIIATALTLIQIRRDRARKIIAYEIVSNAPIATVNKEVKSRVKVLLDGNPVEDCRIVVVQVLNAGDVSIQAADYESPITFDFGNGAEVLNVDVLETNPSDIKPSFTLNAGQVSLDPILLNSQDIITFKALLTRLKDEIIVKGRINGVKGISNLHDLPQNVLRRRWDKILSTNFLLAMLLFTILSVLYVLFTDIPVSHKNIVLLYILMVISLYILISVVCFISWFVWARHRFDTTKRLA